MQPDFLRAMGGMLRSVPLKDWKTYFEFHLANDYASCLSSRFVREAFSFYGTVLSGTKAMKPLWRRTLAATNGALGELLGRLYVEKHFPPEAKKKMLALVADLFTAYEARLRGLDWMTPATKSKALKKLKAFNRKIGYPDKWKSYAGLRVRADDFAGKRDAVERVRERPRNEKSLPAP